jgi:CysZ protein
MVKGAFSGLGYVLQGLRLIRQPELRAYVLIPLLVNTTLFAAGIWYLGGQFERLLAWVTGSLPDWLDWLAWLLWPLFVGVVVLVVFYSFTLVANLIASPFNSLLAEKVELHLTGRSPPDSGGWGHMIRTLPAVLFNELRKTGYFLIRALPLLLLFLIPVIDLAAPFLWVLFSAWMLSLEYFDYPAGNHRLSFERQRDILRQRRMLGLGFGGGVLLLTMIPLVNFIAMPAAVAAATALWVKEGGARE